MSRVIKPESRSARSGAAAARDLREEEGFLSFEELWAEPDRRPGEDPLVKLQNMEADAQRQREELLRQAAEEAAVLKEQARQEGFAQGRQEGQTEGKEAYREKVARLSQVLLELEQLVFRRNARYEGEILVLIKAMVERLVHQETSINPQVIRSCLRNGLAMVAENSTVRVHLHPEDFNRIKEASLEDPDLLAGKARLQLVEDLAVSLGGCRLDTDYGEVDATLENSLQKMYAALDQTFCTAFDEETSSGAEPD